MIKIALCDDNIIHIDELSKILKAISNTYNLDISITAFNCEKELIKFYKIHNDYYDILFLDILMNEINGIELAKNLRNLSCNAYLIFGTISKDYALDSYNVDAYNYILKPYSYEIIEKILLDLSSKINLSKKNIIYVKNNQDIYSFKLENVIYFESNLRKIIAHLSNGDKITFYNKMSNFENEIKSSLFVRCHRSFLINLLYLKNIVSSNIITTTNETIPISKKYLTSTRERFTEYLKSKL